jgi:KDO2-lipid IV(A) lauroyltransferase
MRNLAIAFPDRPLRARRRILRGAFLNLGRMAVELAHLPHLTAEQLRDMVRFEDEAWWREAVTWERSTVILVLSGHFGNWELLVYAHGMRGHPVHMVHRAIANPLVDRWLNALRTRAGTRMIRKSRGAGGVLAALRERGLLVLPVDQNSTRGLGTFVDFFGLAASTNTGLARIALRADAPIVPVFIVREGRRARHRVHVLPVIEAQRTGDLAGDVRRCTQLFTTVFEDMVRRHPEQWLWMHKRWKTRPPGEPRIY